MRAVAAVPHDPAPRLVTLAAPPGEGEVLCRTLELGICGTDREILASRVPLVPPGQPHLILGHECLAVIEQFEQFEQFGAEGGGQVGGARDAGPDASPLTVGTLVVPLVRRPLRPSAPNQRRPDLLPLGAYRERGIVHAHGFSAPRWRDRPEYLIPVPEQLRRYAVFTEPLAVAEKAFNEADVIQRARLSEHWRPRVLVTGLGPIAFAAVVAAAARELPVTVTGRDQADSDRVALLRRWNADYRHLDQLADDPDDAERDGFDLIVECTGSDQVMGHCPAWLASCGIMVWLGSQRRPAAAEHQVQQWMRLALLRNHVYLGAVNAARRDFIDALNHLSQFAASAPDALEGLITRRVGDLQAALPHYRQRDKRDVKVVVTYGS